MNSTTPNTSTSPWPDLKDNLPTGSTQQTRASSSATSAHPRWPNPEASIGIPCCSLGSQKCWEVAGPALHISRTILRDIAELLNQHSDYLHNVSILFSITFGVFMIGSNEHDASPTLVISTERKVTRIRCLNIVRRSGVLSRFPGVLLGSSSHSPTSLQRIQSRDTLSAADREFVFFSPSNTNDVCGRSIHVMERSMPGNLCPTSISQKATIGGFVRLRTSEYDYVYCGLTVAHAFKDGTYFPATISKMDFTFDGETPHSQDDTGDIMMSDGPESQSLGHRSQICNMINVPPQDKTYSNLVESMSIVGIGNQLASSLNGQHPDLDWALIEIQRPHYEPANVTSIDWITGECQLYVERVVPSIRDTVSVLIVTSVGTQTGFVSASSIYYKSHQGASSEEVYVVRLDGRLDSGVTGCWVIDPESGDLYGHIIASCPEARTAYVVPAYRIFNDIREQLGGTLELASRTRTDADSTSQMLGMNQSDDAVIRQLQIPKAIFAEMAVETEAMYQALIVNPSNLKPYIKKLSPYSWHDISDKAKYETMIRLSCSTNPRAQPYWQKGKTGHSASNLPAKWFLFRRFRLAGTSQQRSFGEAHPEDLDMMFVGRPVSRMSNCSGMSVLTEGPR
ncbi:uncharacterized protein LY89DRAFT_733712 [Mollisia scopiformis]|uniref:Uncharacterized protein n=1 Tax=Mollisia scopiformis TaxID=149040 RepID=A0A194X962_MOLSC|nr:uncharacterized protein LY89DRAFT_733712 [Mollisia scopiformis]KUJ16705.1 hypothetical protein LY89DRAFT_733712 [Mollisia scopiformis]